MDGDPSNITVTIVAFPSILLRSLVGFRGMLLNKPVQYLCVEVIHDFYITTDSVGKDKMYTLV